MLAFQSALTAAGVAANSFGVTERSPERATVMRGTWMVVRNGVSPSDVVTSLNAAIQASGAPQTTKDRELAMLGRLQWVPCSNGVSDVAAARTAITALFNQFGLVEQPALNSNHIRCASPGWGVRHHLASLELPASTELWQQLRGQWHAMPHAVHCSARYARQRGIAGPLPVQPVRFTGPGMQRSSCHCRPGARRGEAVDWTFSWSSATVKAGSLCYVQSGAVNCNAVANSSYRLEGLAVACMHACSTHMHGDQPVLPAAAHAQAGIQCKNQNCPAMLPAFRSASEQAPSQAGGRLVPLRFALHVQQSSASRQLTRPNPKAPSTFSPRVLQVHSQQNLQGQWLRGQVHCGLRLQLQQLRDVGRRRLLWRAEADL